jgi:hypothetical protein
MAEGTSLAQLAAWWDALDATTKGILSAVAREAPDTVKQALGAGDDLDLSTGDLAAALDAAPRSESGLRVPYIGVENSEITTEPYEPQPNEPFALYWVDVNQGADSEAYTDQIDVTGPESQSYTLDCAALAAGASGQRTIRVGPFAADGLYYVSITTNSSAPDPDGAMPPAQGYKSGAGIELQLGAAPAASTYTQALNDAATAVVSLRGVDPYRDAVEADGYLKAAIGSMKEALPILLDIARQDLDLSSLGPKVEALDGALNVLQARNAEQVMIRYQNQPIQDPELDSALTSLASAAQAVLNRRYDINDKAAVEELAWLADCLVDVSNRVFLY